MKPVYEEKSRNEWLERVYFLNHYILVVLHFPPLLLLIFSLHLFSLPPFLPFRHSLSSQTISGLRKESVYSVAEACWNHAVFPLAKPTIATRWFAYFPCITRLSKKKKKKRRREIKRERK